MKLEIDIDEDYYKIICKRVKENKPYHSSYEYEVIADGKPLEQEPFINKPCVSSGVCEHDKNKVLDKIRAEIKALSPEPTAYDVVDGNPIKDAVWETLADVLQILDKYNAETEET